MQTPYHEGKSTSFCSSGSAMRLGEETSSRPNIQPPGTQLRSLPGYSTGGRGIDTSIPATPAMVQSKSASSRPYQTRERLYYESETSKAAAPETMAESRPNVIVSRLAEDAPPSISLHDVGTLTPDRRYAQSTEIMVDSIHPQRGGESPSKKLLQEEQATVEVIEENAVLGEGNWVTVFGFTGTQSANAVLSYFKKLGAIEQHELGQGNWMHLKYATRWAAQKALAKSGIILSEAGSCMIGVVPTQRALDQVNTVSESFMSPLRRETMDRTAIKGSTHQDDIFLKKNVFSPPPSTTRRIDLNVASTVNMTNQSNIPHNQNEESQVTKLLGYILGW